MGAQQSRTISRSEIDLDNIIDRTNKELGELDLFEPIEMNQNISNVNNTNTLHTIIVDLKHLFESAFKRSMKNYDKHIKLNNLQFNYKEKNKVILQDLKNKLRLQNDEIKESKEDNYKIIREIQSISNIHKEETRTQKYLIIILIIIVLITLGIIGLFAKRKLSTGSFFIN
jgi:hypothetical protein